MNVRRISAVLLSLALAPFLAGRAHAAAPKAEIKASGLLVVDGNKATLTVKQEHKDANGTSTQTTTQSCVIDGANCRITH